MTGRVIRDASEGIYDDGEWISWDWINSQLSAQELAQEYPHADPAIVEIFHDLVDLAAQYHEATGRYLQIWGELGELYAEVKLGLKRHRPGAAGSDGKIGNDFVEVKTMSPEKTTPSVEVKRSGNFNKLAVVRISGSFDFEVRVIDRHLLAKSSKRLSANWDKMQATNGGQAPSSAT
ncbi:MAG TPA: hypothetical protein VG963_33040 [Polyangiaceae bacterium]|nr:hypothetical protein [Polyangiaceae bacterium]